MQLIDNHTHNMVPFESLPDHKRVPCYAHIMPIKCILWAFLCFVGYCIGIPWDGIVYAFLYRGTFVYQMATQLALNKDCMIGLKDYPDKYFDLAICDPPFGIGDDKLTSGGTWAAKYEKGDAVWDIAPSQDYFTELFRVSKNQIIWGGNYFDLPPNRCFIIWDKIAHLETMADCEYAWSSFDSNAKIIKQLRAGNQTGEERIHICQKPIGLYKKVLARYAKEGDKILDTHLGSGSSRIAAYELGFDFTGFEIDEYYFEAQEKRFRQHTSQTKLFEPKAA